MTQPDNQGGPPLDAPVDDVLERNVAREYSAGFVTDVESDTLPPGLDEDVVRYISARKSEPEWLTEWRLEAYRYWRTQQPPEWAHVDFPPVDFEAISYFSAPRSQADRPKSLDEVDPELLRTYEKLGIPLREQEMLAVVTNVAVDAVFDSVSVATTFKKKLEEAGVKIKTIKPDAKIAWAVALKDWPNERAQTVKAKKKIDMPKIMRAYIAYTKEAGHTYPVDYVIND